MRFRHILTVVLAAACGPGATVKADDGRDMEPVNPWADRVVRFEPGPGAGFGSDRFPDIVLGAPQGAGSSGGSLDVLSLGFEGTIDLEMVDQQIVDGPGIDFRVFENPFTGFIETGLVSASADGETWHAFPCAATIDGGTEGCAGVAPVFANEDFGVEATSPDAGGDGFDLGTIRIDRARFIRIRDSGKNRFYGPPGGGFDLDAVAVIHSDRPG